MIPMYPTTHVQQEMSTVRYKIRHLVLSDVDRVLEIDNLCFHPCIAKDELLKFINRTIKNGIAKVYSKGDKIVGFHLYVVNSNEITMVRLGVDPEYRRNGVAAKLVKEVYRKLTTKRNKLCGVVSEFSDDAIAFFKSMGFIATCVQRGVCEDGSDGYSFRLVLKESIPV